MVLAKIKKALEKKPKFKLEEMSFIDVNEDPVRPELSLEFRQAYGRKKQKKAHQRWEAL